MKLGIINIVPLITLVGMCAACSKTAPQRPTFKGQETVDTTAMQLLLMHQIMAEKADDIVAKKATSEYVLMDENYWVKGLASADHLPGLQEGEYVDLVLSIYDLQDHLLSIHQANVRIGQVDEMQAVVDLLPKLHRSMQVTLLVPWYLGFGSTGNTQVPPYENLKVELIVK